MGLNNSIESTLWRVTSQYYCERLVRCLMRFCMSTAILALLLSVVLIACSWWEAPIVWPILVAVIAVGWLFWRQMVQPLQQPVTPEQMALYIEKRHPELENRLLTAVSVQEGEPSRPMTWMTGQFLKESQEYTFSISFADILDSEQSVRDLGKAAFSLVAIVVFILGSSLIWFPALEWQTPTDSIAKIPLQTESGISIEPGDTRVRSGESVTVLVRYQEQPGDVTFRWKQEGREWMEQELSLNLGDQVYFTTLPDLQEDTQYAVSVNNDESREFTIDVWTPPVVERIDATLVYPEYLGRSEETKTYVGDIRAPEGTRVLLTAHTNVPVQSTTFVREDGGSAPMSAVSDTVFSASFSLDRDDTYHIELIGLEGDTNEFRSTYSLTALRDEPPQVTIRFPQQDIEVTTLDEIPFSFEVTDDNGIVDYGLRYQVAGSEAEWISLKTDSETVLNATQAHTLYLEDRALVAGDLITWTIWANDAREDRPETEIIGDPFFVEIRPFKRFFQEAVSNQGAGQQQGQQGEQGESAEQKEVLIATWNLRRSATDMSEDEYTEQRDAIREAQSALLQEQMNPMGGSGGNAQAAQAMQQALNALDEADYPDPEASLAEATEHQQEAYHILLQSEPDVTQVAQAQASQGGGGGGGSTSQQELDSLELNRQRNFYEEERSTNAQQEMQQNEEAMQSIQELAQRQQAIQDEIAQLISELERATPEEEDEIRRRLERLEEEQRRNLDEMDSLQSQMNSNSMRTAESREAQRQMQEARDQMTQSLEQLSRNELQEARSSGARAMDALDAMKEQLQAMSNESAQQRMQDLAQEFDDLAREQRDIASDLQQMQQDLESPELDAGTDTRDERQQLVEQKEQLANEFTRLMNEAGALAEQTRESQPLLSRELGDWLRETSQEGILESMQQEEDVPLIRYGILDEASQREGEIADQLAQAVQELDALSEMAVSSEMERLQLALSQLDSLVEPSDQAGESSADGVAQPGSAGVPSVTDSPGAAGGSPTSDEAPGSQQENASGQPIPNGSEEQTESSASQGARPAQQGQQSSSTQPGAASEGQQPGQGSQGQPSGNEASGSPSQGSSPGQGQDGQLQPSSSRSGGAPGGQNSPSMQPRGGGGGGGFDEGWWNRGDEWIAGETGQSFMEELVTEDYQQWIERLRNAETLLDEDDPLRTQLTRSREEIGTIRRSFRQERTPPRFDLFYENAMKPIQEVARQLDEKIQAILSPEEFMIAENDQVPEQYSESVSTYFESLAESWRP